MAPLSDLNVGVFIPHGAQLLDTASVDIFGSISREYLSLLRILPAHIKSLAPSIVIRYISVATPGTVIPLTASMNITSTHSIKCPGVQPGELDVVLVPGPDPDEDFDERALAWLRAQMEYTDQEKWQGKGRAQGDGGREAHVLSVCTGMYICCAAGIADGRTVCGPRGLQDDLKARFGGGREINFVGTKYRWWRDGRFWSCGGVTNGNDLVAHYIRTSGRFPAPLAEIVCEMAEVGDRPHLYERSQAAVVMNFLWQFVRAFVMIVTGGRKKVEDKTA